MGREYWIYIVASRTGTLYIGVTNNIERRTRERKTGQFAGFARRYHCNRLVYYEHFTNALSAIAREKQLKRLEPIEKDCVDRIPQSPMGRLSREVGIGDGASGRVDQSPVKTPVKAAGTAIR
jgi:putative endonuclease